MRRALLPVVTVLATALAAAPVMAGSGPSSIKKCGSIKKEGSYVLTKSLSTKGDCIVVETDFVSIDLGGNTLSGDGTGEGVTDNQATLQGITVFNGAIRGFNHGIDLRNSTSCGVDNVRSMDNSEDGIRVGPSGSVANSAASNNGRDGIFVGPGSLIVGNTSRENTGDGIEALDGAVISTNVTVENADDGIDVFCPSNVTGNTAYNNTSDNLTTSGLGCNLSDNVAPVIP